MYPIKINEGFIYVTNFSLKFRTFIQSTAEKAESMLPSRKLDGIGVFFFGSSSRQEMIDESDVDIMIIREKNSSDYILFRSEFIKLLEKENFAKIDVPEWGTFRDCQAYIIHSVTEGNQVVEAKFVYGDISVSDYIERLRERYCTQNRFEKVLCFQKLYFDQYYKQRTAQGARNVKYGHGGTRDFMFVTWFINILDAVDKRRTNIEDSFPMIYKSLSSLYERKLINFENYKKYIDGANVILILRNEILIQNRRTEEEGLTYLDERTLKILFKRKIFKDDSINDEFSLKTYLEFHLNNIAELKQLIWDLFIGHLSRSRGVEWLRKFQDFLNGKVSLEDTVPIDDNNELLQMSLIWNISQKKHAPSFRKVFDKYKRSQSWAVLASLCCHPECPQDVLDFIANGKGYKKGYEYLIRIVSRNKNVSNETLKKIINNPKLEHRYKIVAKTAYEKGIEKANELR